MDEQGALCTCQTWGSSDTGNETDPGRGLQPGWSSGLHLPSPRCQRQCPLCGSGCTLSHTRADLSSATSWLSPPFPFSWSSCPGTFSVASVSECTQVLPGPSSSDLMIQLVWVWGCGMGSIITCHIILACCPTWTAMWPQCPPMGPSGAGVSCLQMLCQSQQGPRDGWLLVRLGPGCLPPAVRMGFFWLQEQCRGLWPGITQCASVCASQVLC